MAPLFRAGAARFGWAEAARVRGSKKGVISQAKLAKVD